LTSVIETPSCGITYDHPSYNSGGVIYDLNIFIISAIVSECYQGA